MIRSSSNLTMLFAILGVVLASGCASAGGGGGGGPVGRDNGLGTIEMQVWNRSDETVAVYARWGNAPRIRLGQLSANRRGTYLAYVQGPVAAISWDVMSARPPAGTGVGFFPPVADSPGDPQCGVEVSAGEAIEWTIQSNSRTCDYIRLDPVGLE